MKQGTPYEYARLRNKGTGGGTTILNGLGTPDDALGVEGDYYIDQGVAMYGPKTSGISYGAGVYATPVALVPTAPNSYPDIEIGNYVNFTGDGRVSAVRYWYDGVTTQIARKVSVWTTGGTRIATANVANDGGGSAGWKEISLTTPLDVTAGQTIVVSVGNTNTYMRIDGATFPVSDGHHVRITQGCYNVPLDAFPASVTPGTNFFTDVVFHELTSELWPIAVQGA